MQGVRRDLTLSLAQHMLLLLLLLLLLHLGVLVLLLVNLLLRLLLLLLLLLLVLQMGLLEHVLVVHLLHLLLDVLLLLLLLLLRGHGHVHVCGHGWRVRRRGGRGSRGDNSSPDSDLRRHAAYLLLLRETGHHVCRHEAGSWSDMHVGGGRRVRSCGGGWGN